MAPDTGNLSDEFKYINDEMENMKETLLSEIENVSDNCEELREIANENRNHLNEINGSVGRMKDTIDNHKEVLDGVDGDVDLSNAEAVARLVQATKDMVGKGIGRIMWILLGIGTLVVLNMLFPEINLKELSRILGLIGMG